MVHLVVLAFLFPFSLRKLQDYAEEENNSHKSAQKHRDWGDPCSMEMQELS